MLVAKYSKNIGEFANIDWEKNYSVGKIFLKIFSYLKILLFFK